MNILKISFLILLLVLIGVVVYSYQSPPQLPLPAQTRDTAPFEKGEKLEYLHPGSWINSNF